MAKYRIYEVAEELDAESIHRLRMAGVSEQMIRTTKTDVENIAEAVSQLSGEEDLVILAESSTTDRQSFFNTLHEDIQEAIKCPVLAVLRENASEEAGEE